ncbi:pentapeptide repeat-containing protein [Nannocystis pusilla]|uniref:Pentapeptide repeat-containing protein n=1 Tax=Nannocystis pusilla TaxID=889268 RepID=A0ABS7TIC2_9BACT|nr:pentapeptide repeat-containing protein [Nannocystis pusilla]
MTSPSSPPPFRPSRNPIVRLVLWFTEPSMIKGMAVGVVLALLGGVALKLDAAWYIASGLMLVLAALVFGAVVGHYLFEARRKRLQRHGLDMLRQAGTELPGLGDELAVVVLQRDMSHLPGIWERLRRIRPAVEEVAGLGLAAFFRMAALSALFAVLGSAISFAVFLTSFMQVERMTEQNELIKVQTDLTIKQLEFEEKRQAVEIALSIADRRQTTAREVFAAITNDPSKGSTSDSDRRNLTQGTRLLITATVSQLHPYKGVDPVNNSVTEQIKSPEQEQILRYLSAVNVDVSEIDLSRAFLDHVDLHSTELPQLQLPGVSIKQAALYDAKFPGANLALADLSVSQLARTDLSGANLTDAKLVDAILVDAVLTDANLVRADLTRANLRKAVLNKAQLGSANLAGVDFAQCDLASADLTDADLALADLSALDRAPLVPKIRAAASWWLAVYSDDYAAKLGVSPDQNARNREALTRMRAAPTVDEARAIVAEAKRAAPSAPG